MRRFCDGPLAHARGSCRLRSGVQPGNSSSALAKDSTSAKAHLVRSSSSMSLRSSSTARRSIRSDSISISMPLHSSALIGHAIVGPSGRATRSSEGARSRRSDGHDLMTAWARNFRRQRLAVVGHGRKAPAAAHPEPGPSGLQIAACQHTGRILPESGRPGRAVVEFVPVGRHHQRVTRMGLPGEQDQAQDATPRRRPARTGQRAP